MQESKVNEIGYIIDSKDLNKGDYFRIIGDSFEEKYIRFTKGDGFVNTNSLKTYNEQEFNLINQVIVVSRFN